MTQEEAIKLGESKWWEGQTNKEIIDFQLYEERLCLPFGVYHKAVEACLQRPVYTHEFADTEALKRELEGKEAAPQSPLESLQRVAPHLAGKIMMFNPNDPKD
ncbi:unnamed protein product [marine sediment metagenome]|uniref:DUF7736 domain-containing protein n=1 Tax=marine sediment metagenome TaxID=412755 RepID=X0S1K2_9ZZZZ